MNYWLFQHLPTNMISFFLQFFVLTLLIILFTLISEILYLFNHKIHILEVFSITFRKISLVILLKFPATDASCMDKEIKEEDAVDCMCLIENTPVFKRPAEVCLNEPFKRPR